MVAVNYWVPISSWNRYKSQLTESFFAAESEEEFRIEQKSRLLAVICGLGGIHWEGFHEEKLYVLAHNNSQNIWD